MLLIGQLRIEYSKNPTQHTGIQNSFYVLPTCPVEIITMKRYGCVVRKYPAEFADFDATDCTFGEEKEGMIQYPNWCSGFKGALMHDEGSGISPSDNKALTTNRF